MALSAYPYSYVFARRGQDHRVLFLIGAAALVLASAIGVAGRFARGRADADEASREVPGTVRGEGSDEVAACRVAGGRA